MREYRSNILIVLLCIATIPGCFSKQNKVTSSKAAVHQKQAAFSFDNLETNIDIAADMADQITCNPEIEAKLYDIPTMVGSIPVEFDTQRIVSEGQAMLAFVSQYDQDMVTNFYHFEMENAGWKRIASIKGFENTLLFQKPKKVCIISIRTLSGKHKYQYPCLVHVSVSGKE